MRTKAMTSHMTHDEETHEIRVLPRSVCCRSARSNLYWNVRVPRRCSTVGSLTLVAMLTMLVFAVRGTEESRVCFSL